MASADQLTAEADKVQRVDGATHRPDVRGGWRRPAVRDQVAELAGELESAGYLGELDQVAEQIAGVRLPRRELAALREVYAARRVELVTEFEREFRRRCPELAALLDRVAAYEAGHMLGQLTGQSAGYDRAEAEMADAWRHMWTKVRATLDRPTVTELRALRGEVL